MTLGLLASLLASVAVQAAADLRGLPDTGWVAWSVPGNQHGDGPCCYDSRGNRPQGRGCNLDKDGGLGVTVSASTSLVSQDELVIYAKREGGMTRQVHAFAADCPVRLNAALTRLSGITPRQSLDWLDAQLGDAPQTGVRDGAIMAIAHHADAGATAVLAQRSASGQARETRKQSLFWLGQARGAEGLPILQEAALRGDDLQVRKHAVFSLAQSDQTGVVPLLSGIVRDAAQPEELRGETLFWLAQSHPREARPLIEAVLRDQASHALTEKAVFALSQLDEGSDQALIAVIEGDYSRQAKKQALFWLGQSGSEDALRALDRLISAQASR
jgi:hypothetical protein